MLKRRSVLVVLYPCFPKIPILGFTVNLFYHNLSPKLASASLKSGQMELTFVFNSVHWSLDNTQTLMLLKCIFMFLLLCYPAFLLKSGLLLNIKSFGLQPGMLQLSHMGQIYQEGHYVRKCLIFVNFEQGLLKTAQSWDVQIFPIFLVSLATARKHWLGYFSLHIM